MTRSAPLIVLAAVIIAFSVIGVLTYNGADVRHAHTGQPMPTPRTWYLPSSQR